MSLTRQQLYELVWHQPVATVARSLDISGSGLKRLCARHQVPTPPKGYWRRTETGQDVPKIPLPVRELGGDSIIPELSGPAEAADLNADATGLDNAKESSPAFSAPPISNSSKLGSTDDAEILHLMKLAAQYDAVGKTEFFLKHLEALLAALDPPTSAVLVMRLDRARRGLVRHDPSAQVIEECRNAATGVELPSWWPR